MTPWTLFLYMLAMAGGLLILGLSLIGLRALYLWLFVSARMSR